MAAQNIFDVALYPAPFQGALRCIALITGGCALARLPPANFRRPLRGADVLISLAK